MRFDEQCVEALDQLVCEWAAIATRKFSDADREPDPIWRRFIAHGAVCYANCATELRETLNATARKI